MSLFVVVPIAVVGLDLMPEGSNPDLFVLTVPLSQGNDWLAMLSFIGGFSSATSMVIVTAMALSTMVSNHLVMPIWLSTQEGSGSVSGDVQKRSTAGAARVHRGHHGVGLTTTIVCRAVGQLLASIGLVAFRRHFLRSCRRWLADCSGAGLLEPGLLVGLTVGFRAVDLHFIAAGDGGRHNARLRCCRFGPFRLGLAASACPVRDRRHGPDGPFGYVVVGSLNTAAFCVTSLLSFPSPLGAPSGCAVRQRF